VPAAEIDRLLDRALPVTHRQEIVLIPPVLFAHDSTAVLPAGEVALHAARDLIAEMPDHFVIEGHADGNGTDEHNAQLSLSRAMVVRDWLVAHGIDGTRLGIEAYGEHRPLGEETDARVREMDRRVTFRAVRLEQVEAP
jgi:OOP family OmpA-OmpF porin